MVRIYEKSTEYFQQKEKQEAIIMRRGQTMHRDKSNKPNRQIESKLNCRKKDMPDNSRNRTKISF